MLVDIEVDQLREDMKDYYGTAMFSGSPMAVTSLSKVESLSDEELVNFAMSENFDINKYIV